MNDEIRDEKKDRVEECFLLSPPLGGFAPPPAPFYPCILLLTITRKKIVEGISTGGRVRTPPTYMLRKCEALRVLQTMRLSNVIMTDYGILMVELWIILWIRFVL